MEEAELRVDQEHRRHDLVDRGREAPDDAIGGPVEADRSAQARAARAKGRLELPRAPADRPVNLPAPVELLEVRCHASEGLARAEPENAPVVERPAEGAQYLFLHLGPEVDEHVPARDHVEAGKGRVAGQVVAREEELVPERALRDEELPFPVEVAVQRSGRKVVRHVARKGAPAGSLDRLTAHIRREETKLPGALACLERVEEQDPHRVGLFSGRAARNPHPEWLGSFERHELRDGGAPQRLDGARIAEEARDVDQEIRRELLDLLGLLVEKAKVAKRFVDASRPHAPLDAAEHRGALVEPEIDTRMTLEHAKQTLERGGDLAARPEEKRAFVIDGVVNDLDDAPGREHVVGLEIPEGRTRHAVEAGALRVLHDHQAARLPQRAQPQGPVASGSGKHHARAAVPRIEGQRLHEHVDGAERAPALQVFDLELAVGDAQQGLRSDHIDAARQDLRSMLRVQHLELGMPAEYLHQEARMVRRQMLHDHEGQAARIRRPLEHLPERLEPSGRCADRDDEGTLEGHAPSIPVGTLGTQGRSAAAVHAQVVARDARAAAAETALGAGGHASCPRRVADPETRLRPVPRGRRREGRRWRSRWTGPVRVGDGLRAQGRSEPVVDVAAGHARILDLRERVDGGDRSAGGLRLARGEGPRRSRGLVVPRERITSRTGMSHQLRRLRSSIVREPGVPARTTFRVASGRVPVRRVAAFVVDAPLVHHTGACPAAREWDQGDEDGAAREQGTTGHEGRHEGSPRGS